MWPPKRNRERLIALHLGCLWFSFPTTSLSLLSEHMDPSSYFPKHLAHSTVYPSIMQFLCIEGLPAWAWNLTPLVMALMSTRWEGFLLCSIPVAYCTSYLITGTTYCSCVVSSVMVDFSLLDGLGPIYQCTMGFS